MTPRTTANPLARLELLVVAGPQEGRFSFGPHEAPVEIGRISSAQCRLDDPTVSRRHAVLQRDGERWVIEDSGSRGGTAVNGTIIKAPTPLSAGDEIGIGPWRLQVGAGDSQASTITIADGVESNPTLHATPRRVGQPLALQRLTLLLEHAERLQRAATERDVAAELLHAACKGAAFPDGVVIRNPGNGTEAVTLAQEGRPGAVSRTVLREASQGQVVRLSDSPELVEAQSLVMGGVRDVLCVPIDDAESAGVFLYLARANAGAASDADDAADFCVALARLTEIALASLRRQHLEREIRAAREAQERLMPATVGEAPGMRYAMLSRPGRGVAGDLLDVIRLDAGRTVVLLGDITGKGAGPGLLMSAAQAFLNGAIQRTPTLLETVEKLNLYLSSRSLVGEFLTLWIGLYDARARVLEYVDAGHGFAAMASADGEATLLQEGGGPPLGLESGALWAAAQTTVTPGDRLLLFSDGLVEQRSPAGEFFGLNAAVDAFTPHDEPADAVAEVARAIRRHAENAAFTDDLTIACFRFDEGAAG